MGHGEENRVGDRTDQRHGVGAPVFVVLTLFVVAVGALIQVDVLSYTSERLGLDRHLASIVLFGSIFGSAIDIPFATAYIAGTLGTLIGADLLNLRRIRHLGGVASIGGAATFDGIAVTGVFAVILTSI
jgi:uncharacterized membrane protein